MALTGKTIGQLTYLSEVNNNTLFPVEASGDTYHVFYSALTNTNYTEVTYDELYSLYTGLELNTGQYYLITDFQTCYDQPNYDNEGNPITTGNFKSGSTEPLLVLATSNTSLSPLAFSPTNPNDLIKYDITFNFTEVTNTPAKGRITERIDNKNNRADYDFRAVEFIRYQAFFSEEHYNGSVSIDGFGNVTGIETTFDVDFQVGDILGVYTRNYNLIGSFAYYEVTSITDSTNMIVSGTTYYVENNQYYSKGSNGGLRSPFQCNVTSSNYAGFEEYYTFNENENYNTYLGDNVDYSTFILSNNVFLNGSYENNTFAGNVVGNTFDDDMNGNIVGSLCRYNIITNDFDRNRIGTNFSYNFIDCDMAQNSIGDDFEDNMIGDYDGYDFDNNQIGSNFFANFITMTDDDFSDNIIGDGFYENIIDKGIYDNIILSSFYNNLILGDFVQNKVGSNFHSNIIKSRVNGNIFGNDFNNNNIYSIIEGNTFGNNSFGNNFGDPNNTGSFSFQNNQVGSNFINNYFSGNTESNSIGDACEGNNVDDNFSYNRIGARFQSNTIANDFGFGGGIVRGNVIGNEFALNTVGEYFYDNIIGDYCNNNNIGEYFTNNKISHGMYDTIIINENQPSNGFQNNNITYGFFNENLTFDGVNGGNPIFYSTVSTNVVEDAFDNQKYVTFLSGGTIVVENIIV
jgi:hypothetical protein